MSHPTFVIPAQAGTHLPTLRLAMGPEMGPRLRGGDEVWS
jgi:hypothetical protein